MSLLTICRLLNDETWFTHCTRRRFSQCSMLTSSAFFVGDKSEYVYVVIKFEDLVNHAHIRFQTAKPQRHTNNNLAWHTHSYCSVKLTVNWEIVKQVIWRQMRPIIKRLSIAAPLKSSPNAHLTNWPNDLDIPHSLGGEPLVRMKSCFLKRLKRSRWKKGQTDVKLWAPNHPLSVRFIDHRREREVCEYGFVTLTDTFGSRRILERKNENINMALEVFNLRQEQLARDDGDYWRRNWTGWRYSGIIYILTGIVLNKTKSCLRDKYKYKEAIESITGATTRFKTTNRRRSTWKQFR